MNWTDEDVRAAIRSTTTSEDERAAVQSVTKFAHSHGFSQSDRPQRSSLRFLAFAGAAVLLIAFGLVNLKLIADRHVPRGPVQGVAGTPSPYRLATYRPSKGSLQARTDGVMGGVANSDGTACLWIESGSHRTALLWPEGYSAKGDPLTVYDGSDNKVATVGQKVTFGGGGLGPEAIMGCKGLSNAWIVAPQR